MLITQLFNYESFQTLSFKQIEISVEADVKKINILRWKLMPLICKKVSESLFNSTLVQ